MLSFISQMTEFLYFHPWFILCFISSSWSLSSHKWLSSYIFILCFILCFISDSIFSSYVLFYLSFLIHALSSLECLSLYLLYWLLIWVIHCLSTYSFFLINALFLCDFSSFLHDRLFSHLTLMFHFSWCKRGSILFRIIGSLDPSIFHHSIMSCPSHWLILWKLSVLVLSCFYKDWTLSYLFLFSRDSLPGPVISHAGFAPVAVIYFILFHCHLICWLHHLIPCIIPHRLQSLFSIVTHVMVIALHLATRIHNYSSVLHFKHASVASIELRNLCGHDHSVLHLKPIQHACFTAHINFTNV